MKATLHSSIGLRPGGEPARAVPIRTGTGCNLWIGDLCITASSADQFRELAIAANAAAVIQEQADRIKVEPHEYRVASALLVVPPPAAGWTCELCDHVKLHEIHVKLHEIHNVPEVRRSSMLVELAPPNRKTP